jgi:hypothetical protein
MLQVYINKCFLVICLNNKNLFNLNKEEKKTIQKNLNKAFILSDKLKLKLKSSGIFKLF